MAIEGKDGKVIGVALKLNATESTLKLTGNFGTKHNSCLAYAHQHECIVIVRSDDEHLKGITVFSHSAFALVKPECYHIVMEGQHDATEAREKFRQELTHQGDDGEGVKYVETPLEFAMSKDPDKGLKLPGSIDFTIFTNVVDTSVKVNGHEGVWHQGVVLILAEGEHIAF